MVDTPPATPPAAPSAPAAEAAAAPKKPGLLQAAADQLKKGITSVLADVGKSVGDASGVYGSQLGTYVLRGTSEVIGDLTKIRPSDQIQQVKAFGRIDDVRVSFGTIKTGLGPQVDEALEVSRKEVVGLITQSHEIMKTSVGKLQTAVRTLDKNVRIVDTRTRQSDEESNTVIRKLQDRLLKIERSKEPGQQFQRIPGAAPEKKADATAASGGLDLSSFGIIAKLIPFIAQLALVGSVVKLGWDEWQQIEKVGLKKYILDQIYDKFIGGESKGTTEIPGIGKVDPWKYPKEGWEAYSKEFYKSFPGAKPPPAWNIPPGKGPTGFWDDIYRGVEGLKFKQAPAWNIPPGKGPTGLGTDIWNMFGGSAQAAEGPLGPGVGYPSVTGGPQQPQHIGSPGQSIMRQAPGVPSGGTPWPTGMGGAWAAPPLYRGGAGAPEGMGPSGGGRMIGAPGAAAYGFAPMGGGRGPSGMSADAGGMIGQTSSAWRPPVTGEFGRYLQQYVEPPSGGGFAGGGQFGGTGTTGGWGPSDTYAPGLEEARRVILSRPQGTLFGQGAPGAPERPGLFGMLGNVTAALGGAAGAAVALGGFGGGGGGGGGGAAATGGWGGGGAAPAGGTGRGAVREAPPQYTPEQKAAQEKLINTGTLSEVEAKTLFGDNIPKELVRSVVSGSEGKQFEYKTNLPPASREEIIKRLSTSVKPGTEGLKGGEEIRKQVYDSFRNAGFSDKQSRALTAEVGRENSYRPELIFGSHSDPANRATNTGFFSWQGSRQKEVLDELKAAGAIAPNGSIIRNQASLDVMAKFARKEMETNPKYKQTKEQFLANPDVDPEAASQVLGKNYIRWRIDDPKYASHKQYRRQYLEQITGITQREQFKGTGAPPTESQITQEMQRDVTQQRTSLAGQATPGGAPQYAPTPGAPPPPSAEVAKASLTRPAQIGGFFNLPATKEIPAEQVAVGSGGWASGKRPLGSSIPYGEYLIGAERPTGSRIAGYLAKHGQAGAPGAGSVFDLPTMQDPKYPNNPRSAIQIHMSHANVEDNFNKLMSEGCLAIQPKDYPRFLAHMKALVAEQGPQVLSLMPSPAGQPHQFNIKPASEVATAAGSQSLTADQATDNFRKTGNVGPPIVETGRTLQQAGVRVSEQSAFGGITAKHTGAGHAEDRALDINIGKGITEASDPQWSPIFDKMAGYFREKGYTVLWKSKGHFDHMHVESPAGQDVPAVTPADWEAMGFTPEERQLMVAKLGAPKFPVTEVASGTATGSRVDLRRTDVPTGPQGVDWEKAVREAGPKGPEVTPTPPPSAAEAAAPPSVMERIGASLIPSAHAAEGVSAEENAKREEQHIGLAQGWTKDPTTGIWKGPEKGAALPLPKIAAADKAREKEGATPVPAMPPPREPEATHISKETGKAVAGAAKAGEETTRIGASGRPVAGPVAPAVTKADVILDEKTRAQLTPGTVGEGPLKQTPIKPPKEGEKSESVLKKQGPGSRQQAASKPKEVAVQPKPNTKAPSQDMPSVPGDRGSGSGGGGTSPERCHFCDP